MQLFQTHKLLLSSQVYAARHLVNSRRSGYLLPKFLAARSVSLSGLSGSAPSASEKYVAWLGAYRFQFILQHLVENIGSRRIWSPASSSLRLADFRTFFSTLPYRPICLRPSDFPACASKTATLFLVSNFCLNKRLSHPSCTLASRLSLTASLHRLRI